MRRKRLAKAFRQNRKGVEVMELEEAKEIDLTTVHIKGVEE